MALATLHWRMLAPVVVRSSTDPTSIIDALYTAGTATTYADGTTRTPGTFASPGTASLPASLGTGSAWTWNYDNTTYSTGLPGGPKTAIYGYPPTTTAINQAVVVCGATSIAAPAAVWKQMNTDARAANFLYLGLAKNSGTYTSWNNATTPFTAGDFTGLGKMSVSNTSFPVTYLFMWECEEAVAFQLVVGSTGGTSVSVAGAFVDPLSTSTLNAETDGRIYGVTVSGGTTYQSATMLAATAGTIMYHVASADDSHFNTFTPGAGTLVPMSRFGSFAPTSTFVSRNGDLPEIPYQLWSTTTGQYYGQLRQIYMTRDSQSGNAWQVGATPKGYLVGSSPQTTSDAVVLTY